MKRMSSEDSKEGSPTGTRPKRSLRVNQAFFKKVDQDVIVIHDDYENAAESSKIVRKKTAVIYDDVMLKHRNLWDENYPEGPERLSKIIDRVKELELDTYIDWLPKPVFKDEEYFYKKHGKDMYRKLEQLSLVPDIDRLEKEASSYDAIYFHYDTLFAAHCAALSVRDVVEEVCAGNYHNGMAFVRPPGHHAMQDEFNGYCFFNNVALAAQHALDKKLAKKILIVDFDVHHGQGTQRMFYEDKRVLYFSIHRYENGTFWPNLRESNVDFIGKNDGVGYNANVPLNKTGLGDSDYLSIVFHILLPLAYDFQPDLILFSAGYDAAVGCFEGLMKVTPSFYYQLIKLLSGLAQGRLVAVLEGGYFIPSLVEGAVRTLLALIDFPPPKMYPTQPPDGSVVQSINDLKYFLRSYWRVFKNIPYHTEPTGDVVEIHHFELKYLGQPQKPPYPTRDCYPTNTEKDKDKFTYIMKEYLSRNPIQPPKGVCYAYNDVMLRHRSIDGNHPEDCFRLLTLWEKFVNEFGFDQRMVRVAEIDLEKYFFDPVHSVKYVNNILENVISYHNTLCKDMYFNEFTREAVLTSVASLLGVADNVMKGNYDSGVALIRPPGHHAEKESAGGFCFINNVAVAANYLTKEYKSRVLIVDWDIHHGNGTQHMFYERSDVLVISIHRYDNGTFFPKSADASYGMVGFGEGVGYNINIPYSNGKLSDMEYIKIFHKIVLPIAYSFCPDVVLVSAGFDAGINDRLGGYKVTPECFGHLTQMLRGLAQGKVILALEGGYNPTTVAYSMAMCIKALLGDPLPKLYSNPIDDENLEMALTEQIDFFSAYWPVLGVHRKLPPYVPEQE